MIPRYETKEMAAIWSEEQRFANWFKIELAALHALEKQQVVPAGVYDVIVKKSQKINWLQICKRVQEIEAVTHHDVIAFLTALEEVLGQESRWIHLGMTSSDIVDTAFALSLVQASKQLGERLSGLTKALFVQANQYKNTICLGRTHGQAAEVNTFGLKLLSFAVEMQRNEVRLKNALDEIAHGKLSGAVGNYGNIDPAVEKLVMQEIGLQVETVSTQIIPRDHHAMFFATLAVIAGGLERLAVEIRHLMRSEVAEVFEPFRKGQKGSSAMPHKKNPILTENITGLARLIRSYAVAAFENQALWHERDISHSSVERVIAPDATTALDFALQRMTTVVKGIEVDAERMQKHIDDTGGLIFSEAILLKLAKKGVLRQTAYVWVQEAAMKARDGHGTFNSNLNDHKELRKHLSEREITESFDVKSHLRHVEEIFARSQKDL
ncbi:MAG: adenylosuccinate lyase [bacterium]|nr:adenylosuccinate lyase [bacterium]